MQAHETYIRRNCRFYAMNESLFGQSRSQLQNVMEEMQISLEICFEHCYLVLTGLRRDRYMDRLGMRRADLLVQLDALEAALCAMGKAQGFACEVCVLNYDYSKRFVLALSPRGEVDMDAIARQVDGMLEAFYARLAPDKPASVRNITAYSARIDSYEAYQQAFAKLCDTYERAFFLRECDVLTAELARAQMTPYSMVEAERALARFSDLLYLRDMEGARALLDELLLGRLKKAQDRQLLAEVLVFLKKRMQDICLVLGVPWSEEIAGRLDMDRFLCMEELHASICALLTRMLSSSSIPPLKPDGLAIRAARCIGRNYYQPLDLTAIAETLHVNPSYLSHTFKSEMGMGITQYITRVRIEQAQRLLRESDQRVSQIAQSVGLDDPRYFNTVFKRHVGCTPTEYREKRS